MGGLTSFASTAMQALSLASSIAGTVDQYRDDSGQRKYEEEKQKHAIAMAGLQQETALKKEQNRLALQAEDADRLRRLRAEIAKQRAIYGASGIGSGGGSSQAYLLGLVDSSDEEARETSVATAIRNRILDSEYTSKSLLSALDVTQAKEKKNLKQVTALYNALGGK